MNRSPRSALLLALLLPLALTGCSPALHYDVDLREARGGDVAVTLRVRGAARDSLVLRGYGGAEMRLSDLAVDAPGSAGFALDSIRVAGGYAPRVVVRGPVPASVMVRWRVAPAIREGDAHMGWTGRSFGDVSEDGLFATGRALFLVPERAGGFGRIRVDVERPSGWDVITPWRRDDAAFVPGIRTPLGRSHAADDLLAATIAAGRFETGSFRAGNCDYVFAFDARIPEPDRARARAALERVIRAVRTSLGRDPGRRYTVLVMGETADGDALAGDGWVTGQGGTCVPLTPTRLHAFARRLIDADLAQGPARVTAHDARERWVLDGIAGVMGWRAVARAGFVDEDDVARGLASEYVSARDMGEAGAGLEEEGLDDVDADTRARLVAPLALLCLERVLGAGVPLDDAVRATLPAGGGTAHSLWSAFHGAAADTAAAFRERYVAGTEALPVERFFTFAPATPAPEPPRGAPVRTLTVAFTANTHGYLENCGCKAGQAGGVARRFTVLKRLRATGPVLTIDAGGAFPEIRRRLDQDALARGELGLYLDAMRTMRYDAAVAGETELAQGFERFRDAARTSDLPWVLANVRQGDTRLAPPWQIVHAGGLSIGVIGLFAPPRGADTNPAYERAAADLSFEDPIEVLKHELPKMRARGVDLVVAAGRLEPALIRRMVLACPDLDVVIASTDRAVVRAEADSETTLEEGDAPGFVGRTLVLYATLDSFGLGSAVLGIDDTKRVASATVAATWLGDDVPDDRAMRATLTRFYDQVGASDTAQASVPPLFANDPARLRGVYAGGAACASCHAAETAQWKGTRHADAYKTLLDVHRHYQPRCVVCHVVGFGTRNGFRIGMTDAKLVNVQCEMCHGPGAEHVVKPVRDNIRRAVPAEVCLECHTPDHSDHFDYATALPRVTHAHGNPPAMADSAAADSVTAAAAAR